jgi:hypothetical protein
VKLYKHWIKFFKLHPRLTILFKVIPIFVLFWLLSFSRLDPDFGWHLKSGEYILHHWIPQHDIFTYSARNYRWINIEWGNDVVAAIFYGLGGYGLVATFYSGLWTLALLLNGIRARLIILFIAAISMLPYAGVRSVTWSVLGVAILIKISSSKSKRVLLSIPVIVLIWANVHGGFIAGLAIISYFAVKYRTKTWFYILLLSVLVTFINPYGPRIYVEVYRTLTDYSMHHQITEWRSFSIPWQSSIFVGLWLLGFLCFSWRKVTDWVKLGPLLFITGLAANRNWPLFAIVGVNDVDNYYTKVRQILLKHRSKPERIMSASYMCMLTALVVASLYSIYLPWHGREYSYPVQAVAYLQSHTCSGNLFNDYNFGGYLIWKLPSQPDYIDGRMATWTTNDGQQFLDRYNSILANPTLRGSVFKQYNVRCVLMGNEHKDIISSLTSSGWKTKVKANGSVLLLAP